MNILALSGSLRWASSNAAFVQAIANLAPPEITLMTYTGLGKLPLFSPDLDTENPPLAVRDLRDCIQAADAVLICTPEYAYGMPGALKNGLDWLVSSASLYRKPVAALSASPSDRGGDRALAWLQQTLSALDALVPPGASFAVPYVRDAIHNNQINNSELIAQLSGMFGGLLDVLDKP